MNAKRPARPGESLLLATTNPAKQERLRWVFAGLGLRFRGLPAPSGPAVLEIGTTLRQNAELKACHWSGCLGGLAAASDGGLVIPALGDRWDPLRTARAAGPEADDLARARHLLELAGDLVGKERAVCWSEALALARDGTLLASWEARGTEALLLEDFRPDQLRPGFWAGSLCYVPSAGTTLAGLADEQLEGTDPTWSQLRERARAYLRSGESDSDNPG